MNNKEVHIKSCTSNLIAELGEPTYFELLENTNKIIKQRNLDEWHFTTLLNINSCGMHECYAENINDTLFLDYVMTSKTACSSKKLVEVTFIIEAKNNREWIPIIKE